MRTRLPGKVVLALAVVALLLSGCNAITGASPGVTSSGGGGEGFAIYLTRDDIPPDRMEALSHVVIADRPIIGPDDIVAYNWRMHDMALTAGAWERLDDLRPPTSGTSFVACVDGQPVYWGAFWPMYSSQSFDGIVIPVCPSASAYNFGAIIQAGYPVPVSGATGDDPRDAPEVKAALAAAGKLKL